MTVPITPEEPKGVYPLDPSQATLEPNAVRCVECARTLDFGDTVCPWSAEHWAEGLHTSEVALGYDNDDEFFNFGTRQYEYPAKEA